MRRASDALLAAAARASRWRLLIDGPVALAPGMKTAYSRGRKAMASVRRHTQAEYCHEWRKRVKDHWYHLRLLEGRWHAAARSREKSLKELEKWLGEHHNLEVLATRLAEQAGRRGMPKQAKLCRGLIRELQGELRLKALALGDRLYREKPEQFWERMAPLWRPRGTGGSGRGPA